MNEQPKDVEELDTRMASAHLRERREVRYEVPIEIEVSGLDRDGQVFHERTFTKDVSEWGCGFTVSSELKVDDIVAVSVTLPGVQEPAVTCTSLFQVVRITRDADAWLVGAWKMDNEKMWSAYLARVAEQERASRETREGGTTTEGGPLRGEIDQ